MQQPGEGFVFGLPRARGDGPVDGAESAPEIEASPRSRGWTLRRWTPRPATPGFPALAGMDLPRPPSRPAASRLPRARGDGPRAPRTSAGRRMASPRSRGWTPAQCGQGGDHHGFPALAGMDPLRVEQAPEAPRLPRARGDGPEAPRRAPRRAPASPRSRGWTECTLAEVETLAGFPALAGMDRLAEDRAADHRGLPRARGDGPLPHPDGPMAKPASPRSRGWTGRDRPQGRDRPGFPALAGMDLRYVYGSSRRRRLPRARGDGPAYDAAAARYAAASPRSRGWTRAMPRAPPRTAASPRSRGWTPGREAHESAVSGFPALAGMDLAGISSAGVFVRLPRARGDGPEPDAGAARPPAASPRSRGWTRTVRGCRSAGTGFPALAGMDPARTVGGTTGTGLPRARGDGPVIPPPRDRLDQASPRSRGWTRLLIGFGDRWFGFPALAGMDPRRPASATS